ncbi:MAG: hypothetical protein E7286_03795 [Lachnospiraceae bacterium]|nr:hypothetical protein [Lachnospiraceae bacterium]
MKSKCKALLIWIFILMILIVSVWCLLTTFFHSRFAPGTWINGVYCTGKTAEEVNAELLSQIEAPCVYITDGKGGEYPVDLAEIDFQADYLAVLKEFQKEQDPQKWLAGLKEEQYYDVKPETSYDQESLREIFEELEPIQQALSRKAEYELKYTGEEGFQLYDGLSGRYDEKKAFEALTAAIDDKLTSGDAYDEDIFFTFENEAFYYDDQLTPSQKKTKVLWEKLEQYYNCDIVYDMGTEEIIFTPDVLSEFLQAEDGVPILDEAGELVLDQEAVTAFVTSLAEQYDTYKKEREFQSTRGDIVTVMGGTYGTLLDHEAEVTFLMEHLLDDNMHTGKVQKHIPAYEREAYARGLNDIGDTYVEIDLTEQKLYAYLEGELLIETEVVTGNEKRGWDTPEGVYFVYAKQKNRTLRGPGYASFVKYWMPVKGGVGIHDARWREQFGGEIYKKNGSHGCINVPSEVMPELYEMAEVGTPVIMFK